MRRALTLSLPSLARCGPLLRAAAQGLPLEHPVSSTERHEQDARRQHPVRADEGEPSVLDPESVFVQR